MRIKKVQVHTEIILEFLKGNSAANGGKLSFTNTDIAIALGRKRPDQNGRPAMCFAHALGRLRTVLLQNAAWRGGPLTISPSMLAAVFGHADRPRIVRAHARLDDDGARLVADAIVVAGEVQLAA